MNRFNCLALSAFAIVIFTTSVSADPIRVYEPGQLPNDQRLKQPKDLNGYFPFIVPDSKAEWETRAAALKLRVKIATGIWPEPVRTPLNPVIHGLVQRPGFTVEKAYFEATPGHFVSGLLFRPDDGKKGIKRPAVLCPHGHGGRQQDYGATKMKALLASGAEKFEASGRFPKLARCAQLARMGCVVYIFDMLGYTDSHQISDQLAHRHAKRRDDFEGKESWGLFSTQAESRLQSVMGIQTWNSVRCLDFLEQLPDVDPKRMAVTGGSGGGTQTILLCAIDDRPIAAFPNGMVSTSMQGGCTCENCTLLRIDSGNVELAALFAPRPQAMTAANDWTKAMMTKGFPELQQLYGMLGVKDRVLCREMLHFPHNYNYESRLTMYRWFNKYLKLGYKDSEIDETDYAPLTAEEYTVWNSEHPKPPAGDAHERALTKYMADESDKQLKSLLPRNAEQFAKYQHVVGGAFRSIIGRGIPDHKDIQRTKVDKQKQAGYILFEDILRLQTRNEELPVVSLFPTTANWNGDVVIWVHGKGKNSLFADNGQLHSGAQQLLDGGASVVAADLFGQGEFLPGDSKLTKQRSVKNTRQAAAYTFCYNDTVFARRVHDLLTVISWIRNDDHEPKRLNILAIEGGGPVAAAARAIAGKAINKMAVDTGGFRFANLTNYLDPDFLPGAVKYGDMMGLLSLSSPNPLWVAGEQGKIPGPLLMAYTAVDKRDAVDSWALQTVIEPAVKWLLAD
jgi:dienelactone hydrolase